MQIRYYPGYARLPQAYLKTLFNIVEERLKKLNFDVSAV